MADKCPDCGEVWPVGPTHAPYPRHNPGSVVCLRRQLAAAQAERDSALVDRDVWQARAESAANRHTENCNIEDHNTALSEEIARLTAERDAWKERAEKAEKELDKVRRNLFGVSRGIRGQRPYSADDLRQMFGPYIENGETDGLDPREVRLLESVLATAQENITLTADNARLQACHEAELGVCEQHCDVVRRLQADAGYVVGQWDGERCQRCGRGYQTVWIADDALWLQIVGHEGGLMCPACFTAACREHGITLQWFASDLATDGIARLQSGGRRRRPPVTDKQEQDICPCAECCGKPCEPKCRKRKEWDERQEQEASDARHG